MLSLFIGQNLHFAIGLLAALACFATSWLHLDAYRNGKRNLELVKVSGFGSLVVSFLAYSAIVEQSGLGRSFLSSSTYNVSLYAGVLGFVLIAVGQMLDPLQKVPKFIDEPVAEQESTVKVGGFLALKAFSLAVLGPVSALAAGMLYLRRATKGREKHLRPIVYALVLWSVFEFAFVLRPLRASGNISIANLVSPLGGIWFIEHITLLVGAVILFRWVWQYLVTRLESQLLIVLTIASMAIFLLTTTTFTFVLLKGVRAETATNLQTSNRVLDYALKSKQSEMVAAAESIASNPALATAVASKNIEQITKLITGPFANRKASSLIITSVTGEVLVRAENASLRGDSLSEDYLVKQSLAGKTASGLTSREGILAPTLLIKGASPIRDNSGTVIGTATYGIVADNALLDDVKHTTGLDTALFAGNVRSATSLVASDGKSRQIGIKESDKTVNNQVLGSAKTFNGTRPILGTDYVVTYSPLFGPDGRVIGMIFAGRPEISLLATVARSIEITLLIAIVLLAFLTIPWYWLALYLKKQLR